LFSKKGLPSKKISNCCGNRRVRLEEYDSYSYWIEELDNLIFGEP
jgi:hypothetical protein